MTNQTSQPFDLVYPSDRYDGRLPDAEVAKLRARLRTLSPAALAVIAGRAALRSAHFIVGHIDEPAWTDEWKDRAADLFVVACRAGRAALDRGGARDLRAEAGEVRDIEAILSAQTEHERFPDGSLVAALAAVRAASADDPLETCLAAVVASVEASFNYPSMDPGTTCSYGPPFASDAASAAADDVRAVSDGIDPSEVAHRPLWPANVWGATMWPRVRSELLPMAASPRMPAKSPTLISRITDRFRPGTRGRPAVPRQEGLEHWVAWFDARICGALAADPPVDRR